MPSWNVPKLFEQHDPGPREPMPISVSELYFHNQEALVERLSNGLRKRKQEVVFLVGSPLSAPPDPSAPGVPNVDGVIDLIRHEFSGEQLELLNRALDRPGTNRYQEAFLFLQGRRGQYTANEIIRNAVLRARTQSFEFSMAGNPDDACRSLELDVNGWALGPVQRH